MVEREKPAATWPPSIPGLLLDKLAVEREGSFALPDGADQLSPRAAVAIGDGFALVGYDRRLCADVLAAFIGAVRISLRRRAKRELGLRSVGDAQIGAITFVQRGDSSIRLNVHFHTLVLDGVYVRDAAGVLRFHALPNPSPEQVADVARWTHDTPRRCRRQSRTISRGLCGT